MRFWGKSVMVIFSCQPYLWRSYYDSNCMTVTRAWRIALISTKWLFWWKLCIFYLLCMSSDNQIRLKMSQNEKEVLGHLECLNSSSKMQNSKNLKGYFIKNHAKFRFFIFQKCNRKVHKYSFLCLFNVFFLRKLHFRSWNSNFRTLYSIFDLKRERIFEPRDRR